MDILNLLLNSGVNSDIIRSMSQKSGLDEDSVNAVISKIAPIFMQSANENFKSQSDSSEFIDMIKHASLDKMAQNPENISINDGNALLGILTGSKDNSRALASEIGSQLGVGVDSVKNLLPMIAPLVAGLLNKQVGAPNLSGNSAISLLTNFIDKNGDGSIVDDVLKMAGSFFGKKI